MPPPRLAALGWSLLAALACAQAGCGGGSPAGPSTSPVALLSLQGRYLLSVRPGASCAGFPVGLLEVEVLAGSAAGRVTFGGPNATGSFQPDPEASSGVSGRLEIFASDVALSRSLADAGRGNFYVFAQASATRTQAAGRDEVQNGTLTGSVTLYRIFDAVNHVDRCSVPGHSWSLTPR
jgi:hypothetical protein